LERPISTYLLGRRMYETLVFWESPPDLGRLPAVAQEFAEIWKGTDKIVYSRTLSTPSSGRTRIEPDFDADAVRKLKETASRDLTVGGPELAGQAIEAGLVDELQLFLVPVVVGGGKRALPDNGVRADLELLDERSFGNGTVFLRYDLRGSPS
jgi:dihydrofolate reductase